MSDTPDDVESVGGLDENAVDMTWTENAVDVTCLPNCTQPADRKFAQCILCPRKFHSVCVQIKSKAVNPLYTCQDCKETFSMLKNVSKELSSLKTFFKKQMSDLLTEMKSKDLTNVKLQEENSNLQTRVNSLTTELNSAKWKGFRENNEKSELLISDFTLSHVDEKKLVNTKVVAKPEGKVESFANELEKATSGVDKYDRIVLVVGSNDVCEKNIDSISEIIPQYTSLLDKAKAKAGRVCVSSICPRLDTPDHSAKISTLNAQLQTMCIDNDCDFIDNNPGFTLSDNTVNDGYLAAGKGPSLSKAGIRKLVTTLKLRTKGDISDITVRPKKTPGRNPSESKMASGRYRRNNERRRSLSRSRNYKYDHSDDARFHRDHSDDVRFHRGNPDDVRFHRDACYYCNEPGHSTDTCRHEGPVTCRDCGLEGHKRKHHSRYVSTRVQDSRTPRTSAGSTRSQDFRTSRTSADYYDY